MVAVLFANLLGTAVIAWSVFRLLRPSGTAARVDLSAGATPLFGGFLAGEVVWSAVAVGVAPPRSAVTTA